MKSEEVALDLAVVGLGQAGGNLAAEFHHRGYSALALNTAQTDLDSLGDGAFPVLPPDHRLYIGLDGYDGAGSDPAYGTTCLEHHSEAIRTAVRQLSESADFLVVCAGLGGGTGSAVRTLLELVEEQPPVLVLLTLPTDNESGLAKVNAMRAVQEVVQLDCAGWLFFDNTRLAGLNQNVAVIDYFAHINSEIIHPLDSINRVNAGTLHAIRGFDGEDLRRILLSGGILRYATLELDRLDPTEAADQIQEALEQGTMMPDGAKLSDFNHLAVVIEATEIALEQTSILAFEALYSQLRDRTGGAAMYLGIYRAPDSAATDSPDEDSYDVTVRVLGSLPELPSRIYDLLEDAREEGEALRRKMERKVAQLDLGDMLELSSFQERPKPKPRPRSTQSPEPFLLSEVPRVADPRPPSLKPRPHLREARREPPAIPPVPSVERPSRPRAKAPRIVQPVESLDFPRRRPRRKVEDDDKPSEPSTLETARRSPLVSRPPGRAEASSEARPALEVVPDADGPAELGQASRPQGPAVSSAPEEPSPSLPERPVSESFSEPEVQPASSLGEAPIDDQEALFRYDSVTESPIEDEELDDDESEATSMMQAVTQRQDSDADPKSFSSGALGFSSPPMALDSLPTGELPDPVVYEDLIDKYRREPGQQLEIAERLYADAGSPMTLVRYYAVEAMVKLREERFLPALEKATSDTDDSIRDIARSGLDSYGTEE